MPAIAAIPVEVIIAVCAILVVLAVYFLLRALIAFAEWVGMPNWPLIGSAIMNALNSLERWVGSAAAWLWQNANPVNIIVATVHWLINELNTVNAWVLTNVWGALDRLVTQTIPYYYNAAVSYAHVLYNDAVGFINTEIASVRSAVLYYYDAAINYAAAEVNAARAFSVQLYNDAITWTDQRVAAAEAAALGLVQSLQGWVAQELGQLRTWVTGEIGTATQTLEGDISAGLHGLEQTLVPEIAGAAAIGAAAAAAFNAWRQSCGDPLCSNLNGFGNIINALEGIISDGALVALIAGAVADPAGTVSVIHNDFAVPVEDAVTTVLGAVGFNLQQAA